MKNYIILSAAFALIIAGCSKNSSGQDAPRSSSVEVYASWSYSVDEFCEFYGTAFDDYCDYLGKILPAKSLVKYNLSAFVTSRRGLLDTIVSQETSLPLVQAKKKWTIQRYNFSYQTVSYSGEPITLSAALIVPGVSVDGVMHRLRALSLCPPHMFLEDERCPTENSTVLMGRVMYNHAVVVPDYQGRGITSSMTCSCLHTHDHAVQAIDAAIAAKTLLKHLGYEFDDGAGLYNVGVSEGGENSYEIQKQIENDVTDEVRAQLNLMRTFVANGSLDHVQYVKDKIARVEYSDQENFEFDMQILKDAFECLTDEEKQGYDSSVFYSTDILSSDGKTINTAHPAILALEKAMERNNISYNWDPKSPLRLVGSSDDTTIRLASHALPAYEMIKNHPDGSTNTYVSLNTFSTPLAAKISKLAGERYMIAHIVADMICFIHAIENEDPSSADISSSFLSELF